MDEISVDERWRELVALYGDKADEELVELRADFDDLTETAQGALHEEMKRRGIWSEKAAPETSTATAAFEDEDEMLAAALDGKELAPGEDWRQFDSETLLLGGVVVRLCEDERDEALSRFLLERVKIQSVVMAGYGQLKVPPGDEQRALAVLERGPSPAVLAAFEAQYAAEQSDQGFQEPTCVKCGSNEVMLESVDPVNLWKCDSCGAEWQDAEVGDAAL